MSMSIDMLTIINMALMIMNDKEEDDVVMTGAAIITAISATEVMGIAQVMGSTNSPKMPETSLVDLNGHMGRRDRNCGAP